MKSFLIAGTAEQSNSENRPEIHFGADPALATNFVGHVSKVKHELSVAA